jgi:hypothetical protein
MTVRLNSVVPLPSRSSVTQPRSTVAHATVELSRTHDFCRQAEPRLHSVMVSPELGEEVVLAGFTAEFEGCMTVYY